MNTLPPINELVEMLRQHTLRDNDAPRLIMEELREISALDLVTRQELEEAQDRVWDLEQQIDALEKRNSTLCDKLDSNDVEIEELKADIEELKADIEELEETIANLEQNQP